MSFDPPGPDEANMLTFSTNKTIVITYPYFQNCYFWYGGRLSLDYSCNNDSFFIQPNFL